jgi:hypothetical protein
MTKVLLKGRSLGFGAEGVLLFGLITYVSFMIANGTIEWNERHIDMKNARKMCSHAIGVNLATPTSKALGLFGKDDPAIYRNRYNLMVKDGKIIEPCKPYVLTMLQKNHRSSQSMTGAGNLTPPANAWLYPVSEEAKKLAIKMLLEDSQTPEGHKEFLNTLKTFAAKDNAKNQRDLRLVLDLLQGFLINKEDLTTVYKGGIDNTLNALQGSSPDFKQIQDQVILIIDGLGSSLE